ncbi:hypothetical protein GCM10023189_58770 [Nibrella saemangeumensis]|uniref:HTH LytTR-type domain-containing protein n=1 Tax=Nibrella saemangeumensis TaxID=1084526 RepID=A0ABP8NRZ8_9BACT
MNLLTDYLRYPALISHLTGADNYTWLSFLNGKKVLLSKPICYFEKRLPHFIRVHKTAVVNPAYIEDLQCPPRRKMAGAVHMKCGTVLPVGRRRWAQVVELLQQPLSKETYLVRDSGEQVPALTFSRRETSKGRRVFIIIKDDMRALLFQKLMEEKWPDYELIFFENGPAMRQMLVACTDRQLPAAIILDLSKSCADMQKTLSFVKSTSRLQHLPILAFTPSVSDANQNYNLGVNAVIKTPTDIMLFTQAVEKVGNYWFSVAALPNSCDLQKVNV